MPDQAQRKARAREVRNRLRQALPEPRCELDHRDAFELLIATILSAQSTDARVNQVTPELFRRYPTPKHLSRAALSDIEQLVRSTGFFRNKAKAIVAASAQLVERHGGVVPRSLDALIELPGVARKTANVVLGTAYGITEGVVVDTHVQRLAMRLGLTRKTDPKDIEADLMKVVPQEHWIRLSHQLIWHGRRVCFARKPNCDGCALAPFCPSAGLET
jgi:endonuclease III